MRNVLLYNWLGRPNWGDELSPILLHHFSDIETTWADPLFAEIVSTGSVLDVLPQTGYTGVVAGSGKLHESTCTDLRRAKVLGLRGRLTMTDMHLSPLDAQNVVLGDPALLVSEMVQQGKQDTEIGVIPHWSDDVLYDREVYKAHGKYVKPVLINIHQDPLDVVAQISRCRKVVSSSLHGLIVADAFGIPRRAEPFPGMISNRWEGKDFKHRDYSSAIGMKMEWGKLQEVDGRRVDTIKYELFDMLEAVSYVV